MIQKVKIFSVFLLKNPSSKDWPPNNVFQSAQKKQFSKESQRSSWASKSFSKHFWHMLWILTRCSNIKAIEWWQFQIHGGHWLDLLTGNWLCYRFLQIDARNACRIFYSFGLTRPLQASINFFWVLKSKIRFHSFVGLDLEHKLSTHHMAIFLELKAMKKNKSEKKIKISYLSALLK